MGPLVRLACLAASAALLAACGSGPVDTVVAGDGGSRLAGPFDDVSIAAREAAATGRAVELVKLRTGTVRTFIRPDGQTLVETTDASGNVAREVRNTQAIVGSDARQTPERCNDGGGPAVTTTTPTLSVDVTDVDHAVHRSKVRVEFQIATSNDRAVQVRGYSAWIESGARATWTVPPGALANGSDYVWRARADDGSSTSDWASWVWQYFLVDTAAEPSPTPCVPVGLGYPENEFALVALGELVKAHPERYQEVGAGSTGIGLYVVRRPGVEDEQVAAEARAEGERAILASTKGGVTDEAKRRAAAALEIELVDFGRAAVEEAYEDLDARVERRDPTLPAVADLTQGVGEHGGGLRVTVVVRATTDAQERDLRERYGDVVRIERIPADAAWTEYESYKAYREINRRRKQKDPTLPRILLAYMPVWDSGVYLKVRDLSDPRVKTLEAQYGKRIRVDDGSKPPMYGPPDDAW